MSVRLTKSQIDDMYRPVLNAMVAYRVGTATDEHYHDILGHLLIAEIIAKMVQRHNHLVEPIRGAQTALVSEPIELDIVETGCEIAKAVYVTTPRKTVSKALKRILNATR